MTDRTAHWNGRTQAAGAGQAPGEWPTLYAQYLLRQAGQSTKTSSLYQQVMDGVARGELPPTVLQDLAPGFIQARGPRYSTRLAEISSRFFSGMVQINASATQALMSLLAPAATPTPPTAPPGFDASDPIGWYQKLTEYAGELSANALAAYQGLLERVAAGEIAPSQIQEASAGYLEQRLPETLNRLGSLYFELLNDLNELRAAYEEEYLTGVLGTARRPGQEAPPALNLAAPLGGTTSTSLTLTNTRSAPAVVHCTVTDVRRADGVGPAFAPQVTVAPPELAIPPGGQASLVLSLGLDPGTYQAGVLYVGAVHIEREGEPRLEIPLRITATPAAPAERPARKRPAAKRTTAKRKTAKRKS